MKSANISNAISDQVLSAPQQFIDYLLTEIFGVPASIRQHIEYGGDGANLSNKKVRIVASKFFNDDFFGTKKSLPVLPLAKMDGIPLLFGQPRVETNVSGQTIIHADLIASAFFLMTRYEEVVRNECRDEHGRFPGQESLPARADCILRPIIDEYGRWLRQLLRSVGMIVAEPEMKFKLTLTHDVDNPLRYTSLKQAIRGTAANLYRRRKNPLLPLGVHLAGWQDPFHTFDWISELNLSVKDRFKSSKFEEIYFFMASDKGPHDGNYRIKSKKVQALISQLKEQGATIGLHPSYAAGGNPEKIEIEKKRLESVAGRAITCSRHHYLRFREPHHYLFLVEAGLTDDYTGGYADCPGFRYGATRPFRFFDPVTKLPTSLTVHPLQIMDISFESPIYLGLAVEDALGQTQNIVEHSIEHQGELVILFHNDLFARANAKYYREFYPRLLEQIVNANTAIPN